MGFSGQGAALPGVSASKASTGEAGRGPRADDAVAQPRRDGAAVSVFERQAQGVVAHIPGPGMQRRFQARAVMREQRPNGLLEARQVTGDGLQEVIGTLAVAALPILVGTGTAGRFHQPAQHHRGPTRLFGQPRPMPRQQRHFAGDHAQPGAATATRGCGRLSGSDVGIRLHGGGKRFGHPRQQLCVAAARVEIAGSPAGVVEHQQRTGCVLGTQLFQRQRCHFRGTGSDQAMAVETAEGRKSGRRHDNGIRGDALILPG